MAKIKNLVIVESPAKARTINKFLGKDFKVEASMGHVKDLPKSELGVDVEQDFRPTYTVLEGRAKVLANLTKVARQMDDIYLAADPDREGEAICFHLAEELRDGRRVHRVLLTEITKRGVLEAFANPTEIDQNKVNAQQARRILDRLVGYKISPLLWEKVRRGLSAGRVQSVALRMIVERQAEIDAFEREEFWTADAHLAGDKPPVFTARLEKEGGKKIKLGNEKDAGRVRKALEGAEWKVSSLIQKERRKNPPPPYITSQLQQDAARTLRFTVRKTMTLAQRLYEGKDLGPAGTVGLITYMRTDSTRVSDQALEEVRAYIDGRYGKEYLPAKPRRFKVRKAAQEAHEAIRPTSLEFPPEAVADKLEKDELRLYTIVWNRFVASQMKPARFLDTRVDVEAGDFLFRAKGSVLKFPGFLAAHRGRKGAVDGAAGKEEQLPLLSDGQVLELKKLETDQHFTQPPPHFNEASLVKALEENGIGRPSTYASILSVIQAREYVSKEKGKFLPSELGKLISNLLTESFGDLINVGYTASLEETLDKIEAGRQDWIEALQAFHEKFAEDLKQAGEKMPSVKVDGIPTDEKCEKCSSPMVKKVGKFGLFLACSAYPDCKNTRDLDGGAGEPTPEVEATCTKCGKPMAVKRSRFGPFLGCTGYPECKSTQKLVIDKEGEVRKVEEQPLDETCPKCNGQMVRKMGRFGPFDACSNYPECKYIKREETGVDCPREGCEGVIVGKRGRRRRFYGCDQYPDCDFVLWNKPVAEACPDCKAPFLLHKTTKRKGPHLICHTEDCDFEKILEEET